ncbi:MAG: alpha/beta hydrolase [Chroococcidiopsidaceae cyanobacterium CP_BM_RX_35]|nr:alpha/beta hydrolase [Chroococcidiopsidaceae cyanobacterium CP_BM_RX_35]
MSNKFITIYGQKIRYTEVGSGPVVVLLHNLGGDLSDWDKTIPSLSQKYRVIAFDQIGAGQSDKPLINYRPATWVDFLNGVYEGLKINSASLVGHSMGGAVAASFALGHTEKVKQLVLVDAGYAYAIPQVPDLHQLGHVPGTLRLLNPSTLEQMQQSLALAFYDRKTYASDAAIDKAFAGSMLGAYAQQRFIESFIRHEDVLDNKLSEIKQPTLIIWGREDRWTPVALGERFKREIPNSELLIVEQCGHFPNIEQADQFNAVVMKFLDGANPSSPG